MADIDRFMSKVKKQPSGCWEWQNTRNRGGYGGFGYKGKVWAAHRWSYYYHKGDPGDLMVCHTCDNRKCVNPEHLWLGTASDNMKDMVAKGRHKSQIGSKNNYAKIDETTARKIKAEAVFGTRKGANNGSNLRQVAEKYNVSYDTVRGIARGVNWKHI